MLMAPSGYLGLPLWSWVLILLMESMHNLEKKSESAPINLDDIEVLQQLMSALSSKVSIFVTIVFLINLTASF